MISVIVSSYNLKQFQKFASNVEETIGVTFEIIRIENPQLMGICEAYNLGAKQAKFATLCFAHDDIIFNSAGWGKRLIAHFKKVDNLGLIGVAGCSYKPYLPTGWSFPHESRFVYMNMKQPKETSHSEAKIENHEYRVQKLVNPVATIDGCFMVTLKNIWKELKFDEINLHGFHGYDIDFSLAVGNSYKVIVVNDVNLTHQSCGKFNSDWLIATFKLHQKWKKLLPRYTETITVQEQREQEVGAFAFLSRKIITEKGNWKELLVILLTPKAIKLLGLKNWCLCLLKATYRLAKRPGF